MDFYFPSAYLSELCTPAARAFAPVFYGLKGRVIRLCVRFDFISPRERRGRGNHSDGLVGSLFLLVTLE